MAGVVKFKNSTDEELLGTIYVYTPYWCRWQGEYNVDDSDDKILLTFEFWKKEYNPLPDFITF